MIYDVIIIGAGVTGCAIARELSRYQAEVCVLERDEDVCCGTSKANSAIVHAGYDCMPGSVMAKMNVRGNEMMDQIAKDLDVPFKRNGSLVVCIDKDSLGGLRELYDRGIANGVKGMRLLSREEALAMEPNISDQTEGALYAPTAGIICPFRLTIGFAENANKNGVDFRFNTDVEELKKDAEGIWHIRTNNGEYKTRAIVNAAGVYADTFHNMVSENKIHITPRRGDYFIMDKDMGNFVTRTIFPQPTAHGKGILVAPTVHGNLLAGPTAIDIDDRESTATTQQGLDAILDGAESHVKNLPIRRKVIRVFAGLRAHEDHHDFILGECDDCPNFFDAAGIESPGLSASPAIGEYMSGLISSRYHFAKKDSWDPVSKGVLDPKQLTMEERNELIRRNPAYGNIVCRCESVSEGEILDAIHRPLGARSLDGIKRRTRAGMGRCQAGFCTPKQMDILHRELGIPYEKITKMGGESYIVRERSKGGEDR